MRRSQYFAASTVASALAMTLGCSNPSTLPTSPSAVAMGDTSLTAGVSLKMSEPTLVAPQDGERFAAATVSLSFEPARGLYVNVQVPHEITVRRPDGTEVHHAIVAGSDSTISYALPALGAGTYEWQTRAAQGDARGPWSGARAFVVGATSGSINTSSGVVGPPRHISTQEAIHLIINMHNAERWNLGRRSSREQRVAFLWRAVAALHYGHPVYNPAGPDADWCVKDAGGGRPPSDDAIVRCSSRDAWDILLSAGGDGYAFHEDYLGRLGREQNVYPPPHSSLPD